MRSEKREERREKRDDDDDDDDAYLLRKMDLVIGKVTKSIPSRQFYLTSVTTGIQ